MTTNIRLATTLGARTSRRLRPWRSSPRPLLTGVVLAGLLGARPGPVQAQGCVQSRGAGTCVLMPGQDYYLEPGQWQAAVGYRWLHADTPFIGGQEQHQVEAAGTQAINDSHFIDLTASYGLTKRLSLNLTIPFVTSTRSSFTDSSDGARHTMAAGGLADLRLTSTFWVFAPDTHHDGNLALGLGVKVPTGDHKATDIAYHLDENGNSTPALAFVDQSIQPSDGGWGVVLEAQGFQKLVKNTYAYMNASYLINPQEKNPDPPFDTGYSIPDAYLLRAGLSYAIWHSKGLSLSLGGRMEGIPVTDWFGDNGGFRRPGYTISIEPGLTWMYRKFAITVTAPVALARNREWSLAERSFAAQFPRFRRSADASFADYLITTSISYRF